MTHLGGTARMRIGFVVTDAMRIVGLDVVLGEMYELVPLAVPKVLDTAGLEIVMIDAAATEHLLELLAAFRRVRPQIRLVVLGPEQDLEHMERVIGAGAKAFVNYAAGEAELRTAIEVVREGSIWAPRKVLARLIEKRGREQAAGSARVVQLTPREHEVLVHLVAGQSNREIGRALRVDEGTVKAHLGRMMRKAGVSNRTALSMLAVEQKWLSERASHVVT